MLDKLKAYWQSKSSNVHGLILFLGGSAGIAALHMVGLSDKPANVIAGACILIGAFLATPDSK
jgi:hypothetical protein